MTKVALVHDFLTQYGGAERVLDIFAQIYEEAPIYTLAYDKKKMGRFYGHKDVRCSWIDKLAGLDYARFKWLLPLYPWATDSFHITKKESYDLVLSNTTSFVKGIPLPENVLHICYLLTPTRYLWNMTEGYVQETPMPSAVRKLLPPLFELMRKWDLKASKSPQVLVATSKVVAERIKRIYNRDVAASIFPPVDCSLFRPAEKIENYWLIVARQEPYKRTDLAVSVATKLGLPLKVVGSGTFTEKLKQLAGPSVQFLGRVSDQELAQLYAKCQGFLFPSEEDAGITPLEAQAAGRPVVAFRRGGATESVIEGVTGGFFDEQTIECLADTLTSFKSHEFDPTIIRTHAQQYDIPIFKQKFQKFINEQMEKKKLS